LGDAHSATDVYYYLNHTWKDGEPLRAPSVTGPLQILSLNGYGGTGMPVKYVYDNKPIGSPNAWSECHMQNPPGDRRFLTAAYPVHFKAGNTLKFSFALVASDRKKNNGCPYLSLSGLNAASDYAQAVFCNPALTSFPTVNTDRGYQLFPNPTKDRLTIRKVGSGAVVFVYSALGQKLAVSYKYNGNDIELDVSLLAPGLYNIVVRTEQASFGYNIMKQ
jgi:hypothetical protein